MRPVFCVAVFAFLAAAACGDSSPEVGGQIDSQEDVQQLFEAVMPDLVAVFTEFANSQQPSLSPAVDKGTGSSVPCPDGGSINIDTLTGQATASGCTVRGITINATLGLFVQPTGPSSFLANFSGVLNVSGTFFGTVEVLNAEIQWSDPPSESNIFWTVTVLLGGQSITVTSGGSGGECADIFGDAPGFNLCMEDAQSCYFFVILNEMSCTDICESFGRPCIGAFSDNNDGCPIGESRLCDDPATDRICVCSKL